MAIYRTKKQAQSALKCAYAPQVQKSLEVVRSTFGGRHRGWQIVMKERRNEQV